jgi:hypothetical protein
MIDDINHELAKRWQQRVADEAGDAPIVMDCPGCSTEVDAYLDACPECGASLE